MQRMQGIWGMRGKWDAEISAMLGKQGIRDMLGMRGIRVIGGIRGMHGYKGHRQCMHMPGEAFGGGSKGTPIAVGHFAARAMARPELPDP